MRKLLFLLFLIPILGYCQFGIPAAVCSAPATGTTFTATQQDTAIANYGRDGAEIIQLGRFVYLIAGWNSSKTPTENNEVYRAQASALTSWTKIANAPFQPRHTFGCGVIGRTIYVWGAGGIFGQSGLGHDCWSATQDVNGDLTWTQRITTLPYALRILYGTAIHKGYMYTIGGETSGSGTGQANNDGSGPHDVWRAPEPGTTWTKVSDGVAGIDAFNINLAGTCVSAWGNLYVVGGGFYPIPPGDTLKASGARVWQSTDDGVTWARIANLPTQTFYPKVIFFNNKVISCQGIFSNRPIPPGAASPFMYLTQALSWITPTIGGTTIPTRHAGAATVITNGCTLYLGYGTGSYTSIGLPQKSDFYTITITP